jgi:uncharacterized protein YndB with AHSA1/START domain
VFFVDGFSAGVKTMSSRKHAHQIELAVAPEEAFAILHTPSAIRNWWFADRAIVLARESGSWAAAWGEEDDPSYVTTATIKIFEPPRRLVLSDFKYYAKEGPLPFEANLTTEFTVIPAGEGSILQVTQDGFPASAAADSFYAACEKGWRDTFESIRRYFSESRGGAGGGNDRISA